MNLKNILLKTLTTATIVFNSYYLSAQNQSNSLINSNIQSNHQEMKYDVKSALTLEKSDLNRPKSSFIKVEEVYNSVFDYVKSNISDKNISSDEDILSTFELVEKGIKNSSIWKGEGLYLVDAISKNKLNCNWGSLFQVDVLQHLGYPVYPVKMKANNNDHLIVAWVKEDGSKFFYDSGFEESNKIDFYSKLAGRNLDSDFYGDTISLKKGAAIFYYNFSYKKFVEKDYSNSLNYANEALEIDPLLEPARVIEALIYSRLDKTDKAISLFDSIKSQDPNAVRVRYLQSKEYIKNGDFVLAKKDLIDSKTINPNFYDSYMLLGKLYCDEGSFDKVNGLIEELEKLGRRQTINYIIGLEDYMSNSKANHLIQH